MAALAEPRWVEQIVGRAGLPADLRIERTVLGVMQCDSQNFVQRLESCVEGLFSLDSHRRIFSAYRRLAADGTTDVDTRVLSAELQKSGDLASIGGVPFLASLIEDLPSGNSFSKYVDILREKAARRDTLVMLEASANAIADPGTDLAEVHNQIASRNEEIRQTAATLSISRRANLLTLADVAPRDVEWLWEPYLAVGMLSLLSGDPGVGKTFLSLAIAAEVTRAGGDVLYLSRENPPAEVTRPRAESLGVDLQRFHCIEGVVKGNAQMPICLSDLDVLVDAMKRTKARLLIIDPIASFLGAKVDAHRSNETRPVLDGLSRITYDNRCCTLMIRHNNKATGGKAIYRGSGSIDFTGAARTEMFAGEHPSEEGTYVMAQGKSNIGPKGSAQKYQVVANGFEWLGECDLGADELMGQTEAAAKGPSQLERAKEFLIHALTGGAREAKAVQAEASGQGFASRTIVRAKDELEVRSVKQGSGKWFWELPNGSKDANKDAKNAESPKGQSWQSWQSSRYGDYSLA